MKFSVIIPLEFNRGLASQCIRAWVQAQTCLRDDYEILVAASETHADEEIAVIRKLLLPQDKLLQFPGSHDMNLVAAAAKQASGEVLVFTESHCLPAPNFLELSSAVLAEHPEWGGFSGRSFAITHNLLSVVESELYERDILFNMSEHPWLKVLDQCLVVRSKSYRAVGGIEPAYGHFAEWHLAGRFHLNGIKIGYAPHVNVGHYYIGDMVDLEIFTRDFIEGEMLCISRPDTDPVSHLFTPATEWENRSRWSQPLVDALYAASKASFLTPPSSRLKYLGWKIYGLEAAMKVARCRMAMNHLFLNVALLLKWKHGAGVFFQRWLMSCVRLGRLSFLKDHNVTTHAATASQLGTRGQWVVDAHSEGDSVGLHQLEHYQNHPFRWSEPVGCMRLPIGPGTWEITLHLLPILSPETLDSIRLCINGQPLRATITSGDLTSLEATHSILGNNHAILSWACPRLSAPHDPRALGLPFVNVQWHKVKPALAAVRPVI